MMRLVIRTILIFSLLSLSAPLAFSCSCETPSQRKTFRSAKAVFMGKVIQVIMTSSFTDKTRDYPYAVKFQVEKSWKGVDKPEITILARAEFLPCEGFRFCEGERYLVYAYE